jgi:hypothetical protein
MGSPGVESLLVYSESRGCRSRCTPAGVATDRQCWSVLASSVMSGIDDYGGSGLVSENEEVRLNEALITQARPEMCE